MNQTQIKIIQETVGAEPDGFWGPKSVAAAQRHLRGLMPASKPWPKTTQAALTNFYGRPGHILLEPVPVPYKMFLYNGPSTVKTIAVHEKLAPSFERILKALGERYKTDEARTEAGVNRFFGAFVNRSMRGGSLPSLHARAAAVDLDANRNGNLTHWPTKSRMPFEVMEIFAREGWLSAGAFWSRDAMHFQATQ